MTATAPQWFHVVLTAYGNWLPGDPRGFRTKHHREHIEGDYRNPPREDHSKRLDRSRRLQRFDSVTLSPSDRTLVCESLCGEATRRLDRLAAVAVAKTHAHLLIRLDAGRPKYAVGRYKTRTTYTVKEHGTPHVRLWARGCKLKPIADATHWGHVFGYVLRHEREAAAVWRWDGPTTAKGPQAVAWRDHCDQWEHDERKRRQQQERDDSAGDDGEE